MCNKCVGEALKESKSAKEHEFNGSLENMGSDDTPFQNIIRKLEKYRKINNKEA